MIKRLRAKIDLDEAVPLNGDVYLGCKQDNIAPPLDLLKQKSDLYNSIVNDDVPDPVVPWLGDVNGLQAWQYDMQGHVKQTVERYCELAKVLSRIVQCIVAEPTLP